MLKEELKKLITHAAQTKDWSYVRAWFTYWDNEDELAEKVILWGRFFFPDYYRDDTPQFHFDLMRDLMSKDNEYNAAPRGFSKTTLEQTCIMFEVVYKLEKYIVLIEKAYDEAAEVLDAVRDGLLDRGNMDIEDEQKAIFISNAFYSCYGKLTLYEEKSKKDKDAYGDMVINGVRLRGKGFDGPIRGLKYKAWRPTKIYVDDIEKDEHIESIDQRLKYKTRYKKRVVPAADPEVGKIKMLGTILHEDSVLKNMIDEHNGKIYRAYDLKDPENTLLWPDRWSIEKLEKKRKEMAEKGKSDSEFYQEYLNITSSDETRPFKWDWLQKTYDELPEFMEIYVAIDVADSVNDTSDYTGVVVVGIDNKHNWHILYAKRYRVTITGLVDVVFDVWNKYKPNRIGIEKKSFDDQVKPLLDVRSDETGIYPSIMELKHAGKRKEDRIIGALQGRFENGKILFADGLPEDQKILQGELYDFPRGKNDDLADALAYISDFSTRSYKEKEVIDERGKHEKDEAIQKILRDIESPQDFFDI